MRCGNYCTIEGNDGGGGGRKLCASVCNCAIYALSQAANCES